MQPKREDKEKFFHETMTTADIICELDDHDTIDTGMKDRDTIDLKSSSTPDRD